MSGRLEGKVALVTGSDVIGEAIGIEFAKEGADVVVNYVTDHEGAAATERAIQESGRRAIVIQADLSQGERGGCRVVDAQSYVDRARDRNFHSRLPQSHPKDEGPRFIPSCLWSRSACFAPNVQAATLPLRKSRKAGIDEIP